MNWIALPNPSMRTKIVGTLGLALLALIGSILSVPLFFSVAFIFGSVAVMLAIVLLGTLPAVLVAIAGSFYTLVAWGHPYAIVIFTAEALVVGLLYRRGLRNLVLADLAYWLMLGVALVLLFYRGVIGMDWEPTALIAIKQPLNGLFNALLAGLIILGLQLSWRGTKRLNLPAPQLADLLFHALLTAILLAGAIPIVHQGQSQRSQAEGFMAGQMQRVAHHLVEHIQAEPNANPARWQAILAGERIAPEIGLALLAADGQVLASQGETASVTTRGEVQALKDGLAIWLPNGDIPAMPRWKQGRYQVSLPVRGVAGISHVVIEQPAKPLVLGLEREHLTLFVFLAGLLLLGILAARTFSRWLARPLSELEAASNSLTVQIVNGIQPAFPASPIQEYGNLGSALRETTTHLANTFQELHRIQASLEEQVKTRTAALEESERQLRYMLETSPIAARIARSGGHDVIFSNPRYAELIHARPNQTTGLDPADYYANPKDYADILAHLAKGEQVFDRLIELNVPEAGTKWTLASYLPIQYQGESAVLGWFYDITELKQAEQALYENKRLLDSVIENIPTMIFMKRADDLRFVLLNKAGEQLLGYRREDLLGKNDYDFFPKEQADFFTQKDREVLEIGFQDIPEEPIDTHTIGRRILHTRKITLHDDHGKAQYLLGISHDITELKLAEHALQSQAQHTQAILDNVIDGIITIDEQGNVTSYNKAAERIFGYAPDEVIGQNVKMLMPEPHRSSHDGFLHRYCATGVAHIIGSGRELEGQRKDGSLFPLDLSISEISHAGQRMFIGVVRDITERKRIERMKNEFVSTVSHELRTPLTSISGALGLINSGMLCSLPEPIVHMTDIAYKNSLRLASLINDLLDMEKIAAGKLRFNMETQPLHPLLEQATEANKAYAEQYRVHFVLTEPADNLQVHVDGQRLIQVLSNLLSNAAKFSPAGSPVEIAAQRVGQAIRVSVSDHGPGIPADFRARIFEKFTQADASDTRQKGGTGLGLAISKELVEHMAGRIGFESEPGQGTTFYFELPAHD